MLEKLKVLLRVIFFSIQKPLNNSNLFQFGQVLHVFLLGISVIVGEVDKRHELLQMRIDELGFDHFKVVLGEVPQLHQFVKIFL